MSRRVLATALTAGASLTVTAALAAPAAAATPAAASIVVPDIPGIPAPGTEATETTEHTRIEVFAADGTTPLGNTPVHPGDEIVVRGYGFDPAANTGGLPVPVLPGTPHGVFIAFGAFAQDWKPSQGAPAEARSGQARSATAWAMTPEALNAVPDAPFDLRRVIRHQWIPLSDDGAFTARITVTPPADADPGARYGIYTYAAAGAVNAAEEHFVPVVFDPAPGPNTPVAPPADLVWGFAPGFSGVVDGALDGSASGSDGASVRDDGSWTFRSAGADIDPDTGLGTVRYEGTVSVTTALHLLTIAVADPWIEYTTDGTWLSARTSADATVGADVMTRVRLARLDLAPDAQRRSADGVTGTFSIPLGQPAVLLPYSGSAIAPLDFGY